MAEGNCVFLLPVMLLVHVCVYYIESPVALFMLGWKEHKMATLYMQFKISISELTRMNKFVLVFKKPA